MTSSGYPRIVKEWKRGTPLEQARRGLRRPGRTTCTSPPATTTRRASSATSSAARWPSTTTSCTCAAATARWRKIDAPNSANKSVHTRVAAAGAARAVRAPAARPTPAGSLLAARFDDFMAGKREFTVLFAPTDTHLAGRLHLDAEPPGPQRARRRQEPPERADARPTGVDAQRVHRRARPSARSPWRGRRATTATRCG